MTRNEMLVEIDFLRLPSHGEHRIGITGQAGEWTCEFDDVKGTGGTPMDAFMAAKELALKEEP